MCGGQKGFVEGRSIFFRLQRWQEGQNKFRHWRLGMSSVVGQITPKTGIRGKHAPPQKTCKKAKKRLYKLQPGRRFFFPLATVDPKFATFRSDFRENLQLLGPNFGEKIPTFRVSLKSQNLQLSGFFLDLFLRFFFLKSPFLSILLQHPR